MEKFIEKDLALRSHLEELKHHKAERNQLEETNEEVFYKCNSDAGNMMRKKTERQTGKHKIMAMAVLLAGACILTYYFHAVRGTCTIFTHFYYIPIILASLWWKRKGLIVAVFLAALLVFSHIVFRPDTVVVNDYFRVLIFIAVAFVIGELSKYIERTQKTLYQREEQFRNLVETTSDWVWEVDQNGVYTYASPRVKELLGYEAEEIIGKTPFDLMPPDEAERIAGMFRAIEESRKPFARLENTNLHKNGRHVVLETSGVPVIDSNGNFQGYRGIDRDITERKKMDEVSRTKDSAIASSINAIAMSDAKGNLIYVNGSFLKMWGYEDEEQVLGRSCLEFWQSREDALKVVETLREKNGWIGELTGTKKDGSTFDVHLSANPVLDDGGKLTNMLASFEDITERKKADEKLKESEERFRTIFDNAADGLLLADAESKKLFSGNKAICQMLGYSPDEIKNLAVTDIHPEEDLPRIIDHFEKQSRGELTLSKDAPVKRKNGSVFYSDINALPLVLGGKKCMLGIFRDVTERMNMEKELKREKEQAEEYLKVAGVMLATINSDENIILINRKGYEILGYKEGELIGKNWFDTLVPEKVREEVRGVFRTLMAGDIEPVEYYENPLLTKDGEERLIAFHNTALRDSNGQIAGVLTSGEDITDRRSWEKALRDSENKHRTLLENLPQKIFLKDKKSVYVSCNENFARDLDIRPEGITGKTDYDFFSKELAEKYRADDARIVGRGQTEDIEEKYIQDGKEVIVHTVKTPVKDQQGNVVGILGIFWDVTELKQAQEKLNQYRETMARAERLASLGTLSATVAHELTQPLTAIRLSIENSLAELEGISCPDIIKEELEDSLTEVSNAASIISRFRNFARRSSEEIISWVNLKATANKIVNLLNESARRAKVTLLVKDMEKLPLVYSNEREIEQLFFVLIENAIQAADGKKNRKLTISGIVKDECIELQLSDNCGGIAPENLSKIFEPFFTTKPIGKATGLGLSIVQHIVSRVGGKVRVESKLGKGSTFFIMLPVNVDGIS